MQSCLSRSRHRSSGSRALRVRFCCVILSTLLLATVLVLFSAYIFRPRKKQQPHSGDRIELIWTSGFPKLLTETAFRLVDCNSDGILDVIFGYGTGVDTLEDNRLLCDLYFDGKYPCNGGVKVSEVNVNGLGTAFSSGFRRSERTAVMEL